MIGVRLAFSAAGKTVERNTYFEAHRAFLRSGRLVVLESGPLFDHEQTQVGALVVADVPSLAEMQAICSEDPFVVEGIYDRVTFFEWRQTIGGAGSKPLP